MDCLIGHEYLKGVNNRDRKKLFSVWSEGTAGGVMEMKVKTKMI
jgi:hypothetical protein